MENDDEDEDVPTPIVKARGPMQTTMHSHLPERPQVPERMMAQKDVPKEQNEGLFHPPSFLSSLGPQSLPKGARRMSGHGA